MAQPTRIGQHCEMLAMNCCNESNAVSYLHKTWIGWPYFMLFHEAKHTHLTKNVYTICNVLELYVHTENGDNIVNNLRI